MGGVSVTTVGVNPNSGTRDIARERGRASQGVTERREPPRSKLEQILGEDPDMGSSEENILMPSAPRRVYNRGEERGLGIMKTTEVHVT